MTIKENINSPQKITGMVELTRSDKALIVTLLFRLIFGGIWREWINIALMMLKAR